MKGGAGEIEYPRLPSLPRARLPLLDNYTFFPAQALGSAHPATFFNQIEIKKIPDIFIFRPKRVLVLPNVQCIRIAYNKLSNEYSWEISQRLRQSFINDC